MHAGMAVMSSLATTMATMEPTVTFQSVPRQDSWEVSQLSFISNPSEEHVSRRSVDQGISIIKALSQNHRQIGLNFPLFISFPPPPPFSLSVTEAQWV